ncbi:MAG: glycerate kinase [Kiritimatiellales bacterium]
MKVVVAIDSFKGCLSSMDAADAAEKGIRRVYPRAKIIKLAIADGGEGTVEALASQRGAKLVYAGVKNPLGRKIRAAYALLNAKSAVLEVAKASGLPLLKKSELNPLKTSTLGTGELIKNALRRGVKIFTIGIGGSATNDGGMGMLAALGVKFFDVNANKIKNFGGANLIRVARIDCAGMLPELKHAKFTVLCDVDNPFCGKTGAAHIYAPQKGASPEMVKQLDVGLYSFAAVMENTTGRDIRKIPGAGAAGGLGGAFLAFMNAKLERGIDGVLDAVKFEQKLSGTDFVITGEGRLDAQSAMGKAPSGIAERAAKMNIPVIAIAGGIKTGAEKLYETNIAAMFSVCRAPVSLEEAMNPKNAAGNLERLCENIFRLIQMIKKHAGN